MRVLTLNCGSSSLRASVIDTSDRNGGGERLADTHVQEIAAGGHADAVATALRTIEQALPADRRPEAVAHRIVHGGPDFTAPVLVDDAVLARLEPLGALAPLHNPPALAALRAARAQYALPHVAVFDTGFHATLPPRAREYALPPDVTTRFGVRRYGFHGISHENVMFRVEEFLRQPARELRIISCHLGNGASVTAIEYGRSVETSMGMTPLEGLVMGTRAGDIDAGVLLHLMRAGGYGADELDALLNRESGLKGYAGTNDLREIERRAAAGDEACRRALTAYAHRLRKYIGAYAAVMGGVDVIAFTGGIGEHSALVRARALQRLDFLGARLDEDRNRDARVADDDRVFRISDGGVALLVVRADEESAMARAAAALLGVARGETDRRVPLAVSARHAHLSQPVIEALFGVGHQLQVRAPLAQHGQYAAQEVVSLVGPHGRIDHVRVLGPPRAADQVEISRTDEFVLGIDAPVRLSGDLANTPGVTLEGPCGRVTLAHGVVCARRHIHMNPADARRLGLADHAVVAVRVHGGRDVSYEDVTVRVAPEYTLQMHLDTDEANAAAVAPGMMGEILE